MSRYFARYAGSDGWRLSPGLAEGRPALLVYNPAAPRQPPHSLMLVEWRNEQIAAIRDYKYVPYVMEAVVSAWK